MDLTEELERPTVGQGSKNESAESAIKSLTPVLACMHLHVIFQMSISTSSYGASVVDSIMCSSIRTAALPT